MKPSNVAYAAYVTIPFISKAQWASRAQLRSSNERPKILVTAQMEDQR